MSVTIDLHHHVIPDFYWEASNEGGEAAGGITPPRWSLEGAVAYLDEGGIDAAVVSISTPGVHFGSDLAARALARRVNEYLADLARRRPDRFGVLASLPLPDLEGSLTELEYALDVTIRLTPHGRSPSFTTAIRSRERRTSSTCSRTPGGRSHSSPRGSASSTR
jgi:6-methylsalicylate decarboxylase